jgi:nucleoside-diphosphate-sugar epimerase
MRDRILITGPGGRVGPHIAPFLREQFALRLLDVRPLTNLPLAADDEFVQADIRDLSAVRKACEGIKAVVHLAAISDEADFHSLLLPYNLEGTYNVFEAARQAGVRKVIFASTGQTVLHYPTNIMVTPDMPPRPWTVYACTKVFGEALARHYSDQYGMEMIAIRICYFQPPDSELLRQRGNIQSNWCSPRDLAQLLIKSLQSTIKFAIFFGVSNNTDRYFDISNAQQMLGYEPVDDAARFLE